MNPLVICCIILGGIILLMLLLSIFFTIKDKIDEKKQEKQCEKESIPIGIWAPGEYEEFINTKGDNNNMEFKAGKKIEVGYENPKTDPFGLLSFRIQMVDEGCDRCKNNLSIEGFMALAKTCKFEEDGREPNIANICRDCYPEVLDYLPTMFKEK